MWNTNGLMWAEMALFLLILTFFPGTYTQTTDIDIQSEFLAPVFTKSTPGSTTVHHIYSHHHQGKLWLLGSTFGSWSLRLNLMEVEDFEEDETACPLSWGNWEYLQGREGQEEFWEQDGNFTVECVSWIAIKDFEEDGTACPLCLGFWDYLRDGEGEARLELYSGMSIMNWLIKSMIFMWKVLNSLIEQGQVCSSSNQILIVVSPVITAIMLTFRYLDI